MPPATKEESPLWLPEVFIRLPRTGKPAVSTFPPPSGKFLLIAPLLFADSLEDQCLFPI